MRLLLYSLTLLLSAVVGDETVSVSPPSAVGDVTPSTTTVAAPVTPPPCVYIAADKCPADHTTPRCQVVNDSLVNDAVICCHIQTLFELKEGLGSLGDAYLKSNSLVTKLHIHNATFSDFNLSEFTTLFRQLTELSVTDGNITRIVGKFTPNFTCLNLSNNTIQSIEYLALDSLHNLRQLNVANNNLTQLPALGNSSITWLDISGSNQLLCSKIKSLANMNRTLNFANDNNTYCILVHSYNWFNSSDRVPLLNVEDFSKLHEECPPLCVCSQKIFVQFVGKTSALVGVDCSNQNLTDLPANLPPNTVSLNVSNNNISSLARLSNDSSYQSIREFYADNNQIPSILILEGSKFMSGFDVLTLRNNQIKIIPTYILSNTFDEHSGVTVKLGHNRVTCDCNAAVTTKNWLMTNQKNVIDFNEVMCDNFPTVKLINLDKNTVCTEIRVWTDYIYYIIAAEVALLILLVAKVTYDYWVFKTAGYLPWPASKMPKMPCDWVFET